MCLKLWNSFISILRSKVFYNKSTLVGLNNEALLESYFSNQGEKYLLVFFSQNSFNVSAKYLTFFKLDYKALDAFQNIFINNQMNLSSFKRKIEIF